MNEQFRECFEYFSKYFEKLTECNFWIAGGALRDFFLYGEVKEETDVDLYFPNQQQFNYAFKRLRDVEKYEVKYGNENVVRLERGSDKVDLVKIFWVSPKECLLKFDFVCSMCAIRPYEIYNHESYFIDLVRKRISINCISDTKAILTRIDKYIDKGFTISKSEIAKVEKYIKSHSVKKSAKVTTHRPIVPETPEPPPLSAYQALREACRNRSRQLGCATTLGVVPSIQPNTQRARNAASSTDTWISIDNARGVIDISPGVSYSSDTSATPSPIDVITPGVSYSSDTSIASPPTAVITSQTVGTDTGTIVVGDSESRNTAEYIRHVLDTYLARVSQYPPATNGD